MEEKLRKLMKHEGVNSTRLAEIMGIQASGISHIMSGRNKPSYDFIVKLLRHFPQINPDWLLMDKGPMYRDEVKNKAAQAAPLLSAPVTPADNQGLTNSLFAGQDRQPLQPQPHSQPLSQLERDDNDIIPASGGVFGSGVTSSAQSLIPTNLAPASSIERIVVFFNDKTFKEYQPG